MNFFDNDFFCDFAYVSDTGFLLFAVFPYSGLLFSAISDDD